VCPPPFNHHACLLLLLLLLLLQDVTSYIQCRGRARKHGSRYCFMQAEETPHSIQHIIM
jgi:hypothetical protein